MLKWRSGWGRPSETILEELGQAGLPTRRFFTCGLPAWLPGSLTAMLLGNCENGKPLDLFIKR